ncbi:hypothetical protein, partial [Zooshikella harenae]
HLLAWIDLLSMPLGGELGEVLTGDDFAYLDNQPYEPWYASAVSVVIPKAYAKSPKKSRLPLGRAVQLLKELKAMKKELDLEDGFIGDLVKQICALMKDKKAHSKSPALSEIRKVLFKPELWRAIIFVKARIGWKRASNMLKGYSIQRLSILEVIGLIAFYQTNISNGVISEKAAATMGGTLKKSFQFGNLKDANGAQFQLAVAASYIASGFKLKGFEEKNYVDLHLRGDIDKLERNVDIVMKGEKYEKWIEVKSLQKGCSNFSRKWVYIYKKDRGSSNKKCSSGGNYRREFFLDRSYAGLTDINSKIKWLVHNFNKKYKNEKKEEGINTKELLISKVERMVEEKPEFDIDLSKQFSFQYLGNVFSNNAWKKYKYLGRKDLIFGWYQLFDTVKPFHLPKEAIKKNGLKLLKSYIPEED